MRTVLILLFLNVVLTGWAVSSEVTEFETDFCTNYPEGTNEYPELWKHCCLIHDMYFWAGGNKQDRYDSDLELRSCIEKTGAINQARIMYYAVRAGSYSPYKYPKRKWNNGWEGRPTFQSLSIEDIKSIENEFLSGYDFISPEIKIYFINNLRSRLE